MVDKMAEEEIEHRGLLLDLYRKNTVIFFR
jgi:hypothetical protein